MSKRPRIKVPYQSIDIFFELVTITLLILIIGYTAYVYMSLPDTIPTHFNAKGEVDDYGQKITVWLVPIIALFMYVGLYIINLYPHRHNYMVNITEENALKNYRFSTRVLRIVNLFTMAILAVVSYAIISAAMGNDFSLGSWFLPTIIGSSILLPVIVLLYYKSINK